MWTLVYGCKERDRTECDTEDEARHCLIDSESLLFKFLLGKAITCITVPEDTRPFTQSTDTVGDMWDAWMNPKWSAKRKKAYKHLAAKLQWDDPNGDFHDISHVRGQTVTFHAFDLTVIIQPINTMEWWDDKATQSLYKLIDACDAKELDIIQKM